jgi:integrase
MSTKARRWRDGTTYSYGKGNKKRWRWQLLAPIDPTFPDGSKERLGKGGYLREKDAEDALFEAKRLLSAMKSPKQSNMTVAEFGRIWLESKNLANSTIQGYDKILRNHVVPKLGKYKMREIIPSTIAKYYKELLAHGRRDGKDFGGALSANTVNKIHVVLGSMFDAALRDGKITTNPFRSHADQINAPSGRTLRANRREIEYWSSEELSDFITWDRDVFCDELHALWVFIARTGVRRGEAIALQWDDIDFTTGTVAIRRAADAAASKSVKSTKTMRDRSIVISASVQDLLGKHKKQRAAEFGIHYIAGKSFVFGTPKNELRNPNDVTARWTPTLTKARIQLPHLPWVTIKGLRHTHASTLLKSGANPKIVQERLGHSTFGTTMDIYSHVAPSLQRDAIENLEKLEIAQTKGG